MCECVTGGAASLSCWFLTICENPCFDFLFLGFWAFLMGLWVYGFMGYKLVVRVWGWKIDGGL